MKNDRSAESYKIAKWFYSEDWRKFSLAIDYACDEPYLSKEEVHQWLASRACPNWSEKEFKARIWPDSTLGKSLREPRDSYAFPLIGASPKLLILEEVLLDFFWKVPFDENGQSRVLQVHIDFSLAMTRYALLGDQLLDAADIIGSARSWLAKTISIYASIDNQHLKSGLGNNLQRNEK